MLYTETIPEQRATVNPRGRNMNTLNAAKELVALMGDIANCFNISEDEALHIAMVATNESEFVAIWENEDWWVA